MIDSLNQLLGTGVLGLQVVTVALFAAIMLRKRFAVMGDVIRQVGAVALPAAFVVTLVASGLTLYYSEILGFEPCPLCWWQRVFLYPQVILLALALFGRKAGVAAMSIALSVIGLAFAVYHHALQMLPSGTLPCPAAGPSCAQITLLEFGYITYPLMAATIFAFVIVLVLARRATLRS